MKNTKTILTTLLTMGVIATTTMSVMALSYDESTITVGDDAAITASVDNDVIEETEEIKEEIELSLNKKKASATEGDKLTLKAKTNSDEQVTFRSTNKKVASVNSKGVVKLKSEGTAKIVAEVEGEKAVCKVTVNKKPNSISDDSMAQIASEIGCQVDYAYDESSIMCSAYSFAYAYYQVTGEAITPGSVWSWGGCVWTGGNYEHYYSSDDMLSSIKAQLDENKACVGLLATDSAYTHYVTFTSYTGDGDSLDDFTIVDPWEGEVTNAGGYSYSYDGYDVVTIG